MLPDGRLPLSRSCPRNGISGSRSTIRSRPTRPSSTSPPGAARRSSSTATSWAGTPSRRAARDNWTFPPRRIAGLQAQIEPRTGSAAPAAAAAAAGRLRRPARRRLGGQVLRRPARSGQARSARLHHPGGSARFPDRDQVRQHPDQDAASRCSGRLSRSPWPARTIRPAPTSSRRLRPSGRTS